MSEMIGTSLAEFRHSWEWLADSSIKATLWMAVLLATLRLMRPASASARHMAAIYGVLGIPLIFLLNAAPIPNELGWRPFAKTAAERAVIKMDRSSPALETSAPSQDNPASGTRHGPRQDKAGSFDAPIGILALWWLGCAVVGVRFLLRLRRPRVSSWTEAPAELKEAAERERAKMNIPIAPKLRAAPNAMPMIHGLWRPTVILPTAAIEWPRAKLTSVLRHEFAHIKRCDVAWSLALEAALLPVWWHPLARILRRKALEWAEQACDDAVINTGVAPTQYAADLLSLSRRKEIHSVPTHGLAAMTRRSQKLRFKRLLDDNANREAVAWRTSAWTGLSALGLLLPTTLLVNFSTLAKNAAPQELPADVARPREVPVDLKPIGLSVTFFEIDFPSEAELETSGLSDWLEGKTQLLSPAEGSQLFSSSKPGTDELAAPRMVMEPGRKATFHVGREEPLSSRKEPEFANVGIEFEAQVWKTEKPDALKVNVTGSVTEVTGYESDETGFNAPQLRRIEGHYQGRFQNGSYLLIGRRPQTIVAKNKIPLLGDVPLLGRLFRTSDIRREKRVIAARLIFSEAP